MPEKPYAGMGFGDFLLSQGLDPTGWKDLPAAAKESLETLYVGGWGDQLNIYSFAQSMGESPSETRATEQQATETFTPAEPATVEAMGEGGVVAGPGQPEAAAQTQAVLEEAQQAQAGLTGATPIPESVRRAILAQQRQDATLGETPTSVQALAYLHGLAGLGASTPYAYDPTLASAHGHARYEGPIEGSNLTGPAVMTLHAPNAKLMAWQKRLEAAHVITGAYAPGLVDEETVKGMTDLETFMSLNGISDEEEGLKLWVASGAAKRAQESRYGPFTAPEKQILPEARIKLGLQAAFQETYGRDATQKELAAFMKHYRAQENEHYSEQVGAARKAYAGGGGGGTVVEMATPEQLAASEFGATPEAQQYKAAQLGLALGQILG